MTSPKVRLDLPRWLTAWQRTLPARLPDDRAAMRVALDACRRNIDAGSGGPFGAVVVAAATGARLAIGVNLVVRNRASVLHAEIVALTLAQQRLGRDSLAAPGGVVLYTTTEPCAMCLGAIPWSGVTRLVCAAREADARAIGFDEGDKPSAWIAGLRRRKIGVTRGLLRNEAVALLTRYRDGGGEIYGRPS
jgi:tRNA(Arg) A34 adenosine deaminase TadA